MPGLGHEQPQVESGRLVVVKSPALDEDDELVLDSSALLLGRGSGTTSTSPGTSTPRRDHARVERRRDGVSVEAVGSTNGTYLNGIRLTRPKRLTPGDILRVGETELRYET